MGSVVYVQQSPNTTRAVTMMVAQRGDGEGLNAVLSLANWGYLLYGWKPLRDVFIVLHCLRYAIAICAKFKLCVAPDISTYVVVLSKLKYLP